MVSTSHKILFLAVHGWLYIKTHDQRPILDASRLNLRALQSTRFLVAYPMDPDTSTGYIYIYTYIEGYLHVYDG